MEQFRLPVNVEYILTKLHDNGYEAYIVGGCVRDKLLSREPHDYDITTSALPQQVEEVFKDEKIIETGIKHGTVTLLLDNQPYEITTYRNEGNYSDHRHPDQVSFSATLKEDVERRDFTINGMAYNHQEGLVDLVKGQEDLSNGIIRCIGDPDERFNEDALRILRAIRFASRFNFQIEEKTNQAIFNNKDLLKFVSSERILTELKEIITSVNADTYLDQYREVLAVFLPELTEMFDFQQCNHHHNLDLWHHSLLTVRNVPQDVNTRMAALFHDIGKPGAQFFDENGEAHYHGHQYISYDITEEILKRLHMSNNDTKEILSLIKWHDYVLTSDYTIKKVLKEMPLETYNKLIALKRADNMAKDYNYVLVNDDYYQRLLVLGEQLSREPLKVSDLNINGYDLLNLGYKGEEIGKILQDLSDRVIKGDLLNEHDVLVEYVERGKNDQ